MLYALLVALITVILAFVVLLDRKDARAQTERDAERAERQTLLQRIQAPEVAVAQHVTAERPSVEDSMPLTDEEIQEERERLDAIERLETLEREAVPWLS